MQALATKKAASKEEKEDLAAATKVKELLEGGTDVRHGTWNAKETAFLNSSQFISAKPVVYLVNMSEKDFLRKKNKHLPKVMQYVKENGGDTVIPYSAAFEQRIVDMPPEDQEKVLSQSIVGSSSAFFSAEIDSRSQLITIPTDTS
jgi:obg-like ATPase 1